MQSLIEKAKEDLAQHLTVATTEINLVEAREVVWPDASLGCPQPGMKYKQVPEDGALIVLQAQGTVYEYHNGGSRGLFLCEIRFADSEKLPPDRYYQPATAYPIRMLPQPRRQTRAFRPAKINNIHS